MGEVSFQSKESFFDCLSKILNQISKKPTSFDLISQYLISTSEKSQSLLPASFSSIESMESELLNFLSRSLENPSPQVDNRLEISEKDIRGDPDRVYMDGCFDLMHSGHYNAIRQAKALGKVLVVGVHSDAEIARNKGPPVMSEQERYTLARACKWVDEVVEDAPYSPTIELLNSLNCRYAAHGDDLSINENGDDCMSILKRAGRCKIFKRTEGISTTQLVGKLLLMTKDAWQTIDTPISSSELESDMNDNGNKKYLLTTSRRISEFSNKRDPKPGDVIVYIDGTFDLFHVGHVETLKRAKALGDYLIVGVHDDQTVNLYKGSNFPIMSLHDRVMCVLSTKFVDEVIIGAPWCVTKELITGFNIQIVATGTVLKGFDEPDRLRKGSIETDLDPFAIPKELGIYREIESVVQINSKIIIDRIIENRTNFFKKFTVFTQREKKYDENKKYVQEV